MPQYPLNRTRFFPVGLLPSDSLTMSNNQALTPRDVERTAENRIQEIVCPYCDSPLLQLVEVALPPEEADQVQEIAAKGAAGAFFGALGGGILAGPGGATLGAALGGGGTAVAVHDQVSTPTATIECTECNEEFTETVQLPS